MKKNAASVCLAVAMLVALMATAPARGDVVEFLVTGSQGEGLLPGNIDPPTSSTGSGAIGLTGITFDTNTNLLSVDIEWGSENGYGDLTGDVILLHLHGPTPSNSPDNFGEVNPDVLVNLGNSLQFNPSGTGGGLVDVFFLSNQQEDYLLSGRTYINVHTQEYQFGEIRGYLLPASVPEPTAASVLTFFVAALASRRRCQHKAIPKPN